MGGFYFEGGYPPYVPVAERRAKAAQEVAKRQKKGQLVEPIHIDGRTIARTFWGKAWCETLEGYGDYTNRLPRGRSYVRNGSVVDLKIAEGRVEALVSGGHLYTVRIDITPLGPARWKTLVASCAGQIDSVVELLRGRLADGVMAKLARLDGGLFPGPKEIKMTCSCPDWATMCKHVAAVLYGIGARLDTRPELLFVLRGVDHAELASSAELGRAATAKGTATLDADDLGDLFGIAIEGEKPKKHAAPAAHPIKKAPAPAAARPIKKAPAPVAARPIKKAPAPAAALPAKRPAPAVATVPVKQPARSEAALAAQKPGRPAAARSAPKPAPLPGPKAAHAPKPASQPTALRRADLLALGVPASVLASWLRGGVLVPTAQRGVYAATSRSDEALGDYLG